SELSPQRVNRVGDVVKVDQEVTVKVLNVDPGARRMSLSIKAALREPEPVEEDEEDEVAPAPRKRTTPLRGGGGDKIVEQPAGGVSAVPGSASPQAVLAVGLHQAQKPGNRPVDLVAALGVADLPGRVLLAQHRHGRDDVLALAHRLG